MSEFTPGKWWIAPPIFDGDAIFAPAQTKGRRNEVVAMGILNKADARLIATAPELYELLVSYWQDEEEFGILNEKRHRKVSDLFYSIDGLEGSHE